MTYEQRRALCIIIKHQIQTGIDNVRRITNEYLLKDHIERQRYMEETRGLYERRN